MTFLQREAERLKLRRWKTHIRDSFSSALFRESCSFCALFNSRRRTTVSNRAFFGGISGCSAALERM